MEFNDQLVRHFGTSDLASLTPAVLASGMERLAVEFGLEKDRGRRFAMWCLMHVMGSAPDLDVAFKDPADQNAARDFMDMLDRAGPALS
ncbi:hypothetical protein H7F51_17350 [Novosphingobium flavum]|uniref:Uncharacterized protein n=1 Tax=Novosphingobium flavum TaxID=1778672 RepID=A0A7X1KN53_9SPHN|nr:hypothetical protein [Novosphingobium flavum]MBC2667287.1 hypothetical protein [Novosphingobium flavum]